MRSSFAARARPSDSLLQTSTTDIPTQLQSLYYGRDVLIPALTQVMEEHLVEYSVKVDWETLNLSWEAESIEEGEPERFQVATLEWVREEAPDGNGDGLVGLLDDNTKKEVLAIRVLDHEPKANLEWLRPDGCKKTKPPAKRVLCLLPPSAGRSDPCDYTIIESRYNSMMVYKTTENGQEMVLQSACVENACTFHAAACPGHYDEKTNPLGFNPYGDFAGSVRFYQEVSEVKVSDEFDDIALLLTMSSIHASFTSFEPNPARSVLEDPAYIEGMEELQAEATPTFAADDIPVQAFLDRLVNMPWQLGAVGDALFPKMVMPRFDVPLVYTIHEREHGEQKWFAGRQGLSGPEAMLADVTWDNLHKPKKMVVHSGGEPILWIKQSGEPKGSPKWRSPEGCHLKSRPKARSNHFFCVVPPGSDDNTPCIFTFQRSKHGRNIFVFQGQDMLYQMFCTGAHCRFSQQNCPGNKYESLVRARWEITGPNQIKLHMPPGQDTGLFMAIASMSLHKDMV